MTYKGWEIIQRIRNRAVWRHNVSHAMILLKSKKGRTIYIVSVSGTGVRGFRTADTKVDAENYVRSYMRHFGVM